MDRAEMVKQLVEMGFDEKLLDSASDELLAQMLKLSEGEEPDGDEDESMDMDDTDQDSDDVEDHAEDDKDHPSDEDVDNMSEEDAKAKLKEYRDKFAAQYAEDEPDKKKDDDAMKIGTEGLVKGGKFSEKALNDMVDRAVAKSLEKHAGKAVEQVQKFAEEATSQQKRAALQKFVEANMAPGVAKIEPWEMDETSGQPTILDRLMACDATTPVFKFSEKGKTTTQTQLEVEMAAIEARPARKFGEKIGAGKGGKGSDDAELAKVEAHYESFAEDFHRLHTSKEEFVEAFKISQKNDPSVTAERFLAVGRAR